MDRRTSVALVLLGLLVWPTGGWARPDPRGRRGPAARPPARSPSAVGRHLGTPRFPVGGRARARHGDYFVRGRHLLAVVDGAGALTDLAPGPDFVDRLGWTALSVCDTNGVHPVPRQRVDIQTRRGYEAIVVRGVVVDSEAKLEVDTTYRIPPGARHLELVTRLKNVDSAGRTRHGVGICEQIYDANEPLVVPGLGAARNPGRHRAQFVGRAERGVALVLATSPRVTPMELSLEYWNDVFESRISADYGRVDLAPGQQHVVRRVLVLLKGPLHRALAEALRVTGHAVRTVKVFIPANLPAGGRLMVRRGAQPFWVTKVPAARRTVSLVLPAAGGPRYSVALWLPGCGVGPHVLVPPDDRLTVVPPPAGVLRVTATVVGQPRVPVKLVVSGRGTTRDPDFGSDGYRVGRVAYSARGVERLVLRPGRYRVLGTRGPDYSLDVGDVTVRRGREAVMRLTLRRVLPAEGWLAADLHLHSADSYDSPVPAAVQTVAAGAAGLDLLMFTNHDAVTEYQPSPDAPLPLVVPGQEVTTSGHRFGHFNVFPVGPGRVLRSRRTTPAQLFRAARRRGAAVLIQVNHPRMGSMGYFDQMGLDPVSGRARSPGYSPRFDLLEVFNGEQVEHPQQVQRVIGDWFALLRAGRRYVATGGSDAHRLPYQSPGCPRTCIHWPSSGSAPKRSAHPSPEQVFNALRQGRAFVTTGPRLQLTLDGQPTGSTVTAAAGQAVALRVRARAAPWLDLTHVELWQQGRLWRTLRTKRRGVVRLDRVLQITPTRDTWFVAIARGDRADPTQLRRVLPFAITNPVWISVGAPAGGS